MSGWLVAAGLHGAYLQCRAHSARVLHFVVGLQCCRLPSINPTAAACCPPTQILDDSLWKLYPAEPPEEEELEEVARQEAALKAAAVSAGSVDLFD